MRLAWDEIKRRAALVKHQLDFANAHEVFDGFHIDQVDDCNDYGEERILTIGTDGQSIIVIVWTPRDGNRRIISMRKANAREQKRYSDALDRSG